MNKLFVFLRKEYSEKPTLYLRRGWRLGLELFFSFCELATIISMPCCFCCFYYTKSHALDKDFSEISLQLKTDIVLERVFDGLLAEVKRLLTYPDWLPIERCRISFYYDKLVSFYQVLQCFTLSTYSRRLYDSLNDTRLNSLVSEILEYKNMRTGVLNSNAPPYLTLVGDQLAVQMDWVYRALYQYPPDFASHFYFDSKMFQDEEVFIGFQVEANNLLQQLASITKKRLEVISL